MKRILLLLVLLWTIPAIAQTTGQPSSNYAAVPIELAPERHPAQAFISLFPGESRGNIMAQLQNGMKLPYRVTEFGDIEVYERNIKVDNAFYDGRIVLQFDRNICTSIQYFAPEQVLRERLVWLDKMTDKNTWNWTEDEYTWWLRSGSQGKYLDCVKQ